MVLLSLPIQKNDLLAFSLVVSILDSSMYLISGALLLFIDRCVWRLITLVISFFFYWLRNANNSFTTSFRLSSSGPVLGTILFPVPVRIAFLPFCQPTISLIPSSALLEPISIFPLTAAKSSPSLGMVVFGS